MRFVKIDYTGRILDGAVFDSTDRKAAEESGILDEKRVYSPMPVIVGEGQVLSGLDDALAEMKVGEKKSVEIPPEKGYGLKDASLTRLVPMKVFKKQKINPIPGMPVELDGRPARVQTVAGGRVRVDFNHDLAGKTLVFDVEVKSEASSEKEKVEFLVERNFNILDGFDVKVSGSRVDVVLPEKVFRDRSLLVRKAGLSAELFKFMKTAEVSFTETWKNPDKREEKAEKKEEKPEP